MKQCDGIVVMGRLPFHTALIKYISTIYETAAVMLLINETVIQRRVGDVGMAEQFIIVH